MTLDAASPIGLAAKLAGARGRVLLHSARDDDGLGGWSFVTAEPSATLIGRGRSLVELGPTGSPVRRFSADPFDAAEAFLAEHGCTLGETRGGDPEPRVIGFFGYDLARVVEVLPGGPRLGADAPDLWLAAYGGALRWRAGDATHALVGPDPSRLRRDPHHDA